MLLREFSGVCLYINFWGTVIWILGGMLNQFSGNFIIWIVGGMLFYKFLGEFYMNFGGILLFKFWGMLLYEFLGQNIKKRLKKLWCTIFIFVSQEDQKCFLNIHIIATWCTVTQLCKFMYRCIVLCQYVMN